MGIAAVAIAQKKVTYFGTALVMLAGIASYFVLGQLEDPDFTIKTAVIATPYPGASPTEVELEVTDRLELAVQQLKALDFVRSKSTAGMSLIWANIKPTVRTDTLPQVWDELRRQVADTQPSLPPGAGQSLVNDDFGDVYGHVIALVSDGFSYAELESYAKRIKKEITLLKGVSKVDLWGAQDEVIYIDVSESLATQLGADEHTLQRTLSHQNLVNDAGSVDLQRQRLRFAPSGEFASTEDVANLIIRVAPNSSRPALGSPRSELIRIRDVAEVRRGYAEPAETIMRFNGQTALAISISNVPGANVVEMGQQVAARLRQLEAELPVGIELRRVHWQSDVIRDAVNGFLVSFAEAVVIVVIVLTIGMGWRLSLIVGSALIVTIFGTFTLMALFGIDLQRMSLGALIIALGMMVDNAIVVADGFIVRLRRGVGRRQAAIEAASQPAIPLLGATVVAVMAFYPIAASQENAGEYCASLFSVVAISLLLSWIVSITVTPVQCLDLIPDPSGGTTDDPHATPMLRAFRRVLQRAIGKRGFTCIAAVTLLLASLAGFSQVKQLFFPASSMTKFMIDYWAPEGTQIGVTSAEMQRIEKRLLQDTRVENVATFVGAGPPRFYLPIEPEPHNAAYGQFIVNVRDVGAIDDIIADLGPWLLEQFPDAQIPLRKYGVGPSNTWKFEVRISGPAVADPKVLRATAAAGTDILRRASLVGDYTTDWRQRTKIIVPRYNEQRGRWAGVTRADVANTTKRAFDGRVVGLYRESDELIPILLRYNETERRSIGGLLALQVEASASGHVVPLGQVSDAIEMVWEDPIVWRRDRRRTITVQANPRDGVTLPELRRSVLAGFENISLPEAYVMEWGGEYESARDSQLSLIPGVIPAMTIIAFIIVALFNAYRPPLVIALSIPFAVIGITVGLLATGAPFGFLALLGAMSLVGMMIKNAVVLLDQTDSYLAAGENRYDAILDAAVSRARPVVLAAATTVLGVIPLLQDQFWMGLAVTIMAGLAFGTALTLLLVPVLYATLFRVKA